MAAKPHRWKSKELALLGTMSDRLCAEQIGIPLYKVFLKRSGLGIPAHSFKQLNRRWTQKIIAMFGKIPDGEIAAALGTSRSVIFNKRVELGIPGFVRQECWRKLTPKEISLLGTRSDEALAKKWGTNAGIIGGRRMALGIPSHRSQHQPTRPRKSTSSWTPEEVALLGTQTDVKIAKILNLDPGTVRNKRLKLGIPANFGKGTREQKIAELKSKHLKSLPPKK